MMKMSFNLATLRCCEVLHAFQLIKDHGYDGVELMLNDTHLHPMLNSPERIMEVKFYTHYNDIPVSAISAGGPFVLSKSACEPGLIDRSPTKRQKRLDFLKRSMELSCFLGSPVLIFNSGRKPDDLCEEEAYEILFSGIQSLLSCTDDLVLALEPEPGFFIDTSVNAATLVRDIASPGLMMNLSIPHVFVSEPDCYERIRQALPYSRHIHIADVRGVRHHHEIPGEGDINFGHIFTILEESEYNGYISVELHHHDAIWKRALRNSRNHLVQFMRKSSPESLVV